jgi:hypothetical protein
MVLFLYFRAWAVELCGNMSYDGSDHNSMWSWFLLDIDLTPEGLNHYQDVSQSGS